MLVGSCNIWSYIITLISGIGIIIATSSVILLYFKSNKKVTDEKEIIQESYKKIPNIDSTLKKLFGEKIFN